MTNKWNSVFYTGVTNDLVRRVEEHKQKIIKGFTAKYNINKLIYYELFEYIEHAILREKQIKGGSRKDKIALIKSINSRFEDLSERIEV